MEIVAKSENGGFEGYGSVFFKLDRHGHAVMPGAFLDSLPKFLKEGFVGGVGHDYGKPIGRYTKAYEDKRGLYVHAKLSEVPEAKTVRTLIKDGVLTKLSVGYEEQEAKEATVAELKELWRKNGYSPNEDDLYRLKTFERKGVRLITKANLLEISPVAVPSNDDARILAYKSLDEVPEFTQFVATARKAAFKLAQKKGRVISGQNEMKLRAMVEVLSSVSEELNALLMLVERQPEMDEDEDQSGELANIAEEAEVEQNQQPEPKKTEETEETEPNKEPAKPFGGKKSSDILARIRVLELIAKG